MAETRRPAGGTSAGRVSRAVLPARHRSSGTPARPADGLIALLEAVEAAIVGRAVPGPVVLISQFRECTSMSQKEIDHAIRTTFRNPPIRGSSGAVRGSLKWLLDHPRKYARFTRPVPTDFFDELLLRTELIVALVRELELAFSHQGNQNGER